MADLLALLVRLQVLPQVQRGPGGVRVGWPALQPPRPAKATGRSGGCIALTVLGAFLAIPRPPSS